MKPKVKRCNLKGGKYDDGGQVMAKESYEVGDKIRFKDKFRNEEHDGIIDEINERGTYVVGYGSGLTTGIRAVQKEEVIGAYPKVEAKKKRFGLFEKGGETRQSMYGLGGKVDDIDSEISSNDLKEELREKMKDGDDVIHFAYTDYGGDFLDKVAIEYFEENYPKNIVSENTAYSGKNAFVFGTPATEWLEASENYLLGFDDIESYYYERQNEEEYKGFNDFLNDLTKNYHVRNKKKILDWLMENRSGYYSVTTQGLDFSYSDLLEELENEGVIKKSKEYGLGGGVGKLTEKDFIESKQFVKGNTLIKLKKLSNPNYYRADYINMSDNEKIGSYGSPHLDDVIHDINTFGGGGETPMARNGMEVEKKYGIVKDLRTLNAIAKKYDLSFDNKFKYYTGDSSKDNKGENLPSYFQLGERVFILKYFDGSFSPFLYELNPKSMVYRKDNDEPAFRNYPNPQWDKDKYYTKFSEGGETPMARNGMEVNDIKYSEILSVLRSKIDEAMDDMNTSYESASDYKGEEVEHESRSGFIPYTDGGYEAVWFETLGSLFGSGASLPTKPLEDEKDRQIEYNQKVALEQFIENNQELVEQIGEDKIDYHSLYELGYGEEAEELSNTEMNYMYEDTIMMRILANYYAPENSRAEDGKHSIRLFGDVNLESPYHRVGNLDDSHEYSFTFNSISELEEKMDKGLSEVLSWFNGDMYNNSKREMRVRKMSNGGSIAEGNYHMILSQAKEVKHHVDELQDILKKEDTIEAWVVAKMENVSSTLSDITHYLDGKSEMPKAKDGMKVDKIEYPSISLKEKDLNEDQTEIFAFIENYEPLNRQMDSIRKNLMTKIARGQFDETKAPKIFMYLIDNGLKTYKKMYGDITLTKKEKEEIANNMVIEFMSEAEQGNYENETFLPKKYLAEDGMLVISYDVFDEDGDAIILMGSEQDLIDFANTMWYYDMLDEDGEEIDDIDVAKDYFEQYGYEIKSNSPKSATKKKKVRRASVK